MMFMQLKYWLNTVARVDKRRCLQATCYTLRNRIIIIIIISIITCYCLLSKIKTGDSRISPRCGWCLPSFTSYRCI